MTSDLDAYYKETKDLIKKRADEIRNDPDFKNAVLRDAEENFKTNNVKSNREKKYLIQAIAEDEMSLRLRDNEYRERSKKIRDDVVDQNEAVEKAYDSGLITSKEYNDYIWKTMVAWGDAYDGFPKETKVDTSGWLPKENKSEKKPSFLTNARINYYKSEIDYLSGPRYKGESDTEYEFRMKQIDEFQRALDKINGK